jgi:hypothetical protein
MVDVKASYVMEVFFVFDIALIPQWKFVSLRYLRGHVFGDDFLELIVCNVLYILDYLMRYISPHLIFHKKASIA